MNDDGDHHIRRITEAISSKSGIAIVGDGGAKERIITELLKISQDKTSLAVSKSQFWQDQGILRTENLGEPTYKEIERMGITPDLIILEFCSCAGALTASKWSMTGAAVVCIIPYSALSLRMTSSKISNSVAAFDLFAICEGNSVFIGEKGDQNANQLLKNRLSIARDANIANRYWLLAAVYNLCNYLEAHGQRFYKHIKRIRRPDKLFKHSLSRI